MALMGLAWMPAMAGMAPDVAGWMGMDTPSGRVGVRELRQNLSVYLDRVKAGETLEVTERGVPVAVLRPITGEMSAVQRLIASGRARPATGRLEDLGPPLKLKLAKPLSQILAEMRAAERF